MVEKTVEPELIDETPIIEIFDDLKFKIDKDQMLIVTELFERIRICRADTLN